MVEPPLAAPDHRSAAVLPAGVGGPSQTGPHSTRILNPRIWGDPSIPTTRGTLKKSGGRPWPPLKDAEEVQRPPLRAPDHRFAAVLPAPQAPLSCLAIAPTRRALDRGGARPPQAGGGSVGFQRDPPDETPMGRRWTFRRPGWYPKRGIRSRRRAPARDPAGLSPGEPRGEPRKVRLTLRRPTR